MDEIFKGMSEIERQAILKAYQEHFKAFSKSKYDLFIQAYISIKKAPKDTIKMTKEEKLQYYKVRAQIGMKKIKNLIVEKKFEETTTEEMERIKDNSEIVENDTFFLINTLKEILKQYTKEEQNKIIKMIITNKKTYHKLLKNFREKYFNNLVKKDYLEEKDKKFYLTQEKKQKKKLKIIELLNKENIDTKEIAKTLNINEETAKKIKENKKKLFLYQIQKLRKEYFKQFKLEELAECLK